MNLERCDNDDVHLAHFWSRETPVDGGDGLYEVYCLGLEDTSIYRDDEVVIYDCDICGGTISYRAPYLGYRELISRCRCQ